MARNQKVKVTPLKEVTNYLGNSRLKVKDVLDIKVWDHYYKGDVLVLQKVEQKNDSWIDVLIRITLQLPKLIEETEKPSK